MVEKKKKGLCVLEGGLETGSGFYLISADRIIPWAFQKYTTGGTEETLFSVKFIQACKRVCGCEVHTVCTLVMYVELA